MKLHLYTNIEWTHWNSFKTMIIHNKIKDIIFNENWHNTFYYALGGNYHYDYKGKWHL